MQMKLVLIREWLLLGQTTGGSVAGFAFLTEHCHHQAPPLLDLMSPIKVVHQAPVKGHSATLVSRSSLMTLVPLSGMVLVCP